MSAIYKTDNPLDEQSPFYFMYPIKYKSMLIINNDLKFYFRTNKPNIIKRFFQRILLGWTWEDV